MQKAEVLKKVSVLLDRGDVASAVSEVRGDYPFVTWRSSGRKYTRKEALQTFVRDGFIDRYPGQKLVYIGALKIFSNLLGEDFPYHRNWKMSETHDAYWELAPTLDHVVPIARGGADDPFNWVTTSMARNSAKSNFLLKEIGWDLLPIEQSNDWDGLFGWATKFIETNPSLLDDNVLRSWHLVALKVI